jgi:uncharacterized membrane protein
MLSYFTNRYAYIGQPLSLAIPLIIRTVFSIGSLFLIGAYLAPFAFLPLLSPKWSIPALLILLSGILSTNSNQHNMLMQYPAAAIPFLFIAFIEVLPKVLANQEVQSIIKRTQKRVLAYSLILIMLISLDIISEGRIKLASFPDSHDAAINQVISLVPNNATVTASNVIFPHLCSRTNAYLDAGEGEAAAPAGGIVNGDWGYPERDTEYIVIDSKNSEMMKSDSEIISMQYTLIKNIDGVELYRLNS